MLKDSINSMIAESMKAHNNVRTETLRLIKSELLKAETADRKAYNEQTETKVLLKMVAAHKDSIAQFAGRQDLIDKEQAELDIIQEFAPKEVSEEEIILYTRECIKEHSLCFGMVSMKDMKTILSKVQKKYPTAEGKLVSTILKEYI